MVKLKTINKFLIAGILLINGYVLVSPFVPSATFLIQTHVSNTQQKLAQKVAATSAPLGPNAVTIPSMLLDQKIYEGSIADTYKTLDKGIWRWPGGSTPDKGSNTVLLGHRFTYSNPRGVLYSLDKVKLNDSVGLVWNNKRYLYKVTSIQVVPPTDVAIQNPTSDPQITIFTCTPTWWPHNRLVVTAKLQGTS